MEVPKFTPLLLFVLISRCNVPFITTFFVLHLVRNYYYYFMFLFLILFFLFSVSPVTSFCGIMNVRVELACLLVTRLYIQLVFIICICV